jgi:hypothetical protein
LTQPLFRLSVPESFAVGEGVKSEPRALVTEVEGVTTIACLTYGVEGVDPQATSSLGVLLDVLRQFRPHCIKLEPGDLLIFDNLRAMHARTAFAGSRWLQRVYLRPDLSALQRATNSSMYCRVFDASLLMG